MVNPLKKYHIIRVIIIYIHKGMQPERVVMWSNSHDNMAWRIWETLEEKQNCIILAGDDILSKKEVEIVKEIGAEYYEKHKAEIDG